MSQETPAICAICDCVVLPSSLRWHFESHDIVNPDEYRLRTWPDGTTVLLDFSFLREIGK